VKFVCYACYFTGVFFDRPLLTCGLRPFKSFLFLVLVFAPSESFPLGKSYDFNVLRPVGLRGRVAFTMIGPPFLSQITSPRLLLYAFSCILLTAPRFFVWGSCPPPWVSHYGFSGPLPFSQLSPLVDDPISTLLSRQIDAHTESGDFFPVHV